MKKFLSALLLLSILSTISHAQQITQQNNAYGGFPFIYSSEKLFQAGGTTVWVENQNYSWPSRITPQSGITYLPSKLGVQPQGNPIVGAWKTPDGSTWLAHSWLPGNVLLPEPATGGLLKATRLDTGGNFQLFNSLFNVPLQQVKEPIWHAAVPVGNGNQVWLSSDSGLRRLDVNSLASTLLRKENLPIPGTFKKGKNTGNNAFFGNEVGQWLFLENLNPVAFSPDRYLELSPTTKVFDLEITGGDTLFTADSIGNQNYHLFQRTNGQTIRLTQTDSLSLVRKEAGGAIWFTGFKTGLFRLKNGQMRTFPLFAGKQVNDLLIDSLNHKWILADGKELYLLNDISPRIHFPDTAIDLCKPGPSQFTDSSTTIGDGIASRLWNFGDGNTSTEANPQHRFQRGGLYYISLTATDQNGAQNTARDTIMVFGDEYHRLNSEREITTCQPVRLDFYSIEPVRWTLPNGTQADTQFVQATQSGLYRVQTVGGRCLFKDSVRVNFRGESTTDIGLEEENGQTIGETVSGFPPLTINANTPTEFCAYKWFLNGDSIGLERNQTIILSEPGTNTIRVEACDFSGCKYIGERQIRFENGIIPNVVTQNSDRLNDFFEIRSSSTKKLNIYNRWGKTVFQNDNYQNNWPATDDKPGTYFYRLEMGGKIFNGWVEVVR